MSWGWLARATGAVVGGVLRLVFLASVVAGGYGVYVAWFVSLGQDGPGHDRLAGTIWMAYALGASLVASGLLLAVPPLARSARAGRYASVYAVFAVTVITFVLPLSGALRCIGTWERTNTQVTTTASGCTETDDGDGGATYLCDLSWTMGGRAYSMERYTNGVYPDGTPVLLWVDPVTGGPDDHDWAVVTWCFIGAAVGGAASVIVLAACAEPLGLSPSAWRRRRRNHNRAARVRVPAQTPAAPPIRDAVVTDLGGDAVIEDARPDRRDT